MNTRDDRNRSMEGPGRAEEGRKDTTEISVDEVRAGPAGVVEREVTVRRTEPAPERGRESKTGSDLEQRVDSAAEKALHRAGDALQRAAPAIGRGAEKAVRGSGSAVSAASGAVGTLVGKIAGRIGGWWESAREAMSELPEEEQKACLLHFEAYEVRPAGMTFERALPGYTLGYVAAGNPDYRGRGFEEIEPDLRRGFGEEGAAEYDSLREFSRYGFERGAARW